MIIGLNGRIKSGKDTVGQMIQYLTSYPNSKDRTDGKNKSYNSFVMDMGMGYEPEWKIKKFAEKLKQIASILTGIPREKFEDQDFKESNMSPEWNIPTKVGIEPDGLGGTRFSMTGHRPMTYRTFLQKLGTEAIRNNIHVNAWVNAVMADIKDGENVIFTDCRFPNEAQAIKDRGGIVIRINRYPPGCSPKLMDEHPSEKSLDDWDFDHVIYNVGTLDDLRAQIKEILRQHKLIL